MHWFFLAIRTEPKSDCLGTVYVFMSYSLGLSKAYCLNSLVYSVCGGMANNQCAFSSKSAVNYDAQVIVRALCLTPVPGHSMWTVLLANPLWPAAMSMAPPPTLCSPWLLARAWMPRCSAGLTVKLWSSCRTASGKPLHSFSKMCVSDSEPLAQAFRSLHTCINL